MESGSSQSELIVFSDLDGTLLDHDTYAWEGARPALDALKQRNIPLVLASSKTAAEMAPLRRKIGFDHCPAIVENGAGLLSAHHDTGDQDRSEYHAIRAGLDALPKDLRQHFRGFGDIGTKGIAETTGLPDDQAALAGNRAFSEPGLWSGTDAQQSQFEALLAEKGIAARSGGRFLTLSFGRTKAGQMDQVCEQLFGNQRKFMTVALGDAPNDMEMLLKADRAFVIHNPHAKPIVFSPDSDQSGVTHIGIKAPAGWNQAVLSIVSPP